MTKITYRNELGAVTFGEAPINLLKIDGLMLPKKQYSTFLYSDGSGQTTCGEATLARNITLTADIYLKNRSQELSKMLRILNKKGVLEITNGYRKRKIDAYLSTFLLNERHGKYQCFTLQFVCDYPYFSDFRKREAGIFVREDLIEGEFTLPDIFTRRSGKMTVELGGEMPCEPIVRLSCKKAYEGTGEGIKLINHTNGNFFTLNYSMSEGEEITIDFRERTVTNASGTSLIHYISEDTFLSEFKLEPGENEIEVINGENSEVIAAVMEYKNIYAEAAI